MSSSSSLSTLSILLAGLALTVDAAYNVTILSYPSTPLFSWLDGNTPFPQTFNPSYVEPSPGTNNVGGLLLRVQNCTLSPFKPGYCIGCNVDSNWPIAPYFPGSLVAFAPEYANGTFGTPYVIFGPDPNAPTKETYGTEDPRMAYDSTTGLYHLYYTCYSPPPYLCHATTTNPTIPWTDPRSNWTRYGAVFPTKVGSKSAALFFNNPPASSSAVTLSKDTIPSSSSSSSASSSLHYLYWGAGTIGLATSTNLVNWTTIIPEFITTRSTYFDTGLVEAGPPPLYLNDGNIFFMYNSATKDGNVYQPGWVVINGTDPTQILVRSDNYLLTPTQTWERGVSPSMCNVPNVIFVEAMRKRDDSTQDIFDIWFGGSDSVIGTATIQVTNN